MEELVAWVNAPDQNKLVAPIKAGIFMYQFLTVHPYMDGNGRTARMFATYIMRRGGLGLKTLFVGRSVAALASDPHVIRKSGTILHTAELAKEYGFTDTDGTQPRPVTLEEA